MISSLIISVNWFVYIWAVNSGKVIETSLGYYINPLIVILMGTFILKERLDSLEKTSILLAAAGVLILTIQYRQFPWTALFLATSFALYGLCKKLVSVESLTALGIETLLVSPAALIYLWTQRTELLHSLTSVSPVVVTALILAGVFTALPLLWFAKAARTVTFSILGFTQYLSPTITLLLGIFIFREPFSIGNIASFGLIWSGLGLFSVVQTRKWHRVRQAQNIVKGA